MPGEEEALAAEEVGGAAAEQQEAAEHQRVAVDDPLQVRGGELQVRLDGRSATFTIVASSTTMNWARQTRTRTSVALAGGRPATPARADGSSVVEDTAAPVGGSSGPVDPVRREIVASSGSCDPFTCCERLARVAARAWP
jgi:hypothetical protein